MAVCMQIGPLARPNKGPQTLRRKQETIRALFETHPLPLRETKA